MNKPTPEEQAQIEAADQRYEAAMHSVQTGIAYGLEPDSALYNYKNVRVGITSCQVTDQGLAELLIDKGIITQVEYHEYMAKAAEVERARWEALCTKKFGREVTLG